MHQSFALAHIKNNSFKVRVKLGREKKQAQSLNNKLKNKLLKSKRLVRTAVVL